MRYAFTEVVFQEVPDEVSLVFFISGCPHRCPGCHSATLWSEDQGQPLSLAVYTECLDRYQDLLSCVCFFGGDWWPEELQDFLQVAQKRGLKTCLYTGLDQVDPALAQYLDYLKTGPWRPQLGGLNHPKTNQRMIRVSSGELLNHRFQSHKDLICKDF